MIIYFVSLSPSAGQVRSKRLYLGRSYIEGPHRLFEPHSSRTSARHEAEQRILEILFKAAALWISVCRPSSTEYLTTAESCRLPSTRFHVVTPLYSPRMLAMVPAALLQPAYFSWSSQSMDWRLGCQKQTCSGSHASAPGNIAVLYVHVKEREREKTSF